MWNDFRIFIACGSGLSFNDQIWDLKMLLQPVKSGVWDDFRIFIALGFGVKEVGGSVATLNVSVVGYSSWILSNTRQIDFLLLFS